MDDFQIILGGQRVLFRAARESSIEGGPVRFTRWDHSDSFEPPHECLMIESFHLMVKETRDGSREFLPFIQSERTVEFQKDFRNTVCQLTIRQAPFI